MNKILLLVATLFALSSCGGPDNSAPKKVDSSDAPKDKDYTHQLANEALLAHVSEPARFKVLEYGKMDSCFTEILDFHVPYSEAADFYKECYEKDIKTNPAKAKADLDSVKANLKKDADERANFKPEFFGWKMSVRFQTDTIYTGDVYFNIDQNFAILNRYGLLKQEGIIKE